MLEPAAEIPPLPRNVLDAVVAHHAPDWHHRELTRVLGPNGAALQYRAVHGQDPGPTDGQRQLYGKAVVLAASKGWAWDAVKERARRQAGLNEEWHTPEQARQVAMEREREAGRDIAAVAGQRSWVYTQMLAAFNQGVREAAAKSERQAIARATRARATEDNRKVAEVREQLVEAIADRIGDRLRPGEVELIRGGGTKAARRSFLNSMTLVTGCHNPELLMEGLNRAAVVSAARHAAEAIQSSAPLPADGASAAHNV